MYKSLIIARYNEDLSWLEEFKDFKIIVYNKGDKLSDNLFYEVINLENKGRESHTWLHHIVKNYYNLNEITVFLQGKIDDLNCMAYKNPNDYLKKINKYGFKASRYGLLGPFPWDWNVNIEIYIAGTECSGTPEVLRSGTVVFTDTTLIISLNSNGSIFDTNFDYILNSSNSEITMILGDEAFFGSMELNESSATFEMVFDFGDNDP